MGLVTRLEVVTRPEVVDRGVSEEDALAETAREGDILVVAYMTALSRMGLRTGGTLAATT